MQTNTPLEMCAVRDYVKWDVWLYIWRVTFFSDKTLKISLLNINISIIAFI